MSGTTARARRLATLIRPERPMDGYANLIAARLRRLATTHRTGVLPFAGGAKGAIYLDRGAVVYAESARTPSAGDLERRPIGPVGRDRPPAADPPPSAGITAILARAEATADASRELLSGESRYAKFRAFEAPATERTCAFAIEELLAEVSRRQRLLKQMSALVAPDDTVLRRPEMREASLRVSARQWAILARVGTGATPRGLAWSSGSSVFATTIEVYRLILLGLLTRADYPGRSSDAATVADVPLRAPLISFIRAASEEKGVIMPGKAVVSPGEHL